MAASKNAETLVTYFRPVPLSKFRFIKTFVTPKSKHLKCPLESAQSLGLSAQSLEILVFHLGNGELNIIPLETQEIIELLV